jgi:hypothetical protein
MLHRRPDRGRLQQCNVNAGLAWPGTFRTLPKAAIDASYQSLLQHQLLFHAWARSWQLAPEQKQHHGGPSIPRGTFGSSPVSRPAGKALESLDCWHVAAPLQRHGNATMLSSKTVTIKKPEISNALPYISRSLHEISIALIPLPTNHPAPLC